MTRMVAVGRGRGGWRRGLLPGNSSHVLGRNPAVKEGPAGALLPGAQLELARQFGDEPGFGLELRAQPIDQPRVKGRGASDVMVLERKQPMQPPEQGADPIVEILVQDNVRQAGWRTVQQLRPNTA